MKRLSLGFLAIAMLGAGCSPATQTPADDSVEVIQETQTSTTNEGATNATSTTDIKVPVKATTPSKTTTPPNLQPSAPTIKPKPGPQTMTVTILPTGFSPQTMAINVGDTVVWVNKSGGPQTSRNAGSSLLWDSGNIPNGASYKHVFNAPGSYPYISGSSSFTGSIVVHEIKE